MYNARILLDSISPCGVRLTTIEVTFPRIVLSEFNTHRVFSRNSASSRAIPVEKRISMVSSDPFIPEAFGKNQKGMQASEDLSDGDAEEARHVWLKAKNAAVDYAEQLSKIGVHKQLANRLLEPFAWQTVIVTSSEWDNFFALRCNKDAQPEIRKAAELMREATNASTPKLLNRGDWHLPLIFEEDANLSIEEKIKLSVARCARVSYLTHDGRRDIEADFTLYDRLLKGGHMSPMEHAAQVAGGDSNGVLFVGNFRFPFVQHRKMLPGEAIFNG